MTGFRRLLCAALAALSLLPGLAAAEPAAIYLVRHGEKMAGQDPELTPQGQARARNIAAILHRAGITSIFSSPTVRARQTAAPLAQRAGLSVQLYDPLAPRELVEKVRGLTGAVLVVGHSNTLPELVRLFGGAPGQDIGDDEYDRLYQLLPGPDGRVRTILLGTPTGG
jgi:broad specificity phosphatase PhoE